MSERPKHFWVGSCSNKLAPNVLAVNMEKQSGQQA